ncbi:MAG: glycosyltransferase family 2 protein [Actinobacteria bacterium]|nr:glycosyltransferase family 2 protein [Actinomycetota bacterium]
MKPNRTTHPGSAGPAPDVSVIIVNWNLRDLLRRCLESVRLDSEGLNVETVVVDNDSTDGSAGMVADEFPEAVIIANRENAGFGRASNQGMEASRGRYLFFLNNDATLFEGALGRMVGYMEAHPEAGACGPRVVNPDGSLQVYSKGYYPSIPRIIGQFFLPQGLRHPFGRSLGLYESSDRMEAREFEWLSGCALLVRREAVEKVGSLNADVFMYCEDMDWCYRMRLAGWKVMYLPQAKVEHLGGQSMKMQHGAAVGSHAAGLLAFYSRYHGVAATAVFRAVLLAGYTVQAAGWLVAALFGRGGGLDKLRRVFRAGKQGRGGGK